jgi:CubicO group peptidase (beta-lactamase class C family)
MRLPVALLFGLVLLVAAPVWTEALPSAAPGEVGLSAERLERLGQVVRREIEAGRYPGAVVLVARKGRVAYLESFGRLDQAAGTPMPKDAIFRLYSMTKPFTSVAAMMLMEEGKLRLADPVSRFLPQLAKLEVVTQTHDSATGQATHAIVTAEREPTIYDLLRHTSGFAYGGFTPNARVKELYTKGNVGWADQTPAEQIERLAKVPLAHQPGTAWEYSLSTDVLGRVIEVVTGAALGRFLGERIFNPLGMVDTTFVVPADKARRLAQAFPTDKATGKPIKLVDVTAPPKNDAGGAGSAGTAMDYARFLQMMLNGGRLEGARLLSRTSVRHMTSDHLGDIKVAMPRALTRGYGFGLGFAVRKADGLESVPGTAGEYRWGGAAGTHFWVDPKEELITVVMTQAPPGPPRGEDRQLFRQMVLQAIAD